MRSIRRVGGLAVAGFLLSAVASGPAASAATPAAYAGSASGYALKLTLANQGITAGASAAKAASDGTGEAQGSGALSALPAPLNAVGDVKAVNPPGETKAETCGQVLPPAQLAAIPVEIGLGCGSASATGTGAASVATANGKVAGIEANLNTVLTQIPVTQPITSALTGALNQICAGIPAQLQPTGCAVTGEAQALVQSLAATQTLNGDVGSSTSGVAVDGNSVTTESTASGAVIRLLPNATLNGVPIGEPLITITVSRANAKVLCDLGSGNAVPSFDPAIVRVKFSNPLAAILPNLSSDQLPIAEVTLPGAVAPIAVGTPLNPTVALQNGELTVTPGSTVVLLPGTPAQTEIVVGGGTSRVNPDKTAAATADGVKIHALQLAPAPLAGGLLANLAHAEVAAGCTAAVADVAAPPAPAAPEITRELPRTGPGSDIPWLPLAGVAGLALAVLSRRAIVRSR
jgi:LPXTG-motif cell wall-anchored protein